jgi:hypothetical protein
MLFVMVLLGIIMGIGVAGFDRMDPGYKGLQSTVETFLESSRDRARSSGHPVMVQLQTSKEDGVQRLERFLFRRSMEATFEPRFRQREGVHPTGDAGLDGAGRFGAGADLEKGGTVEVAGRGTPNLEQGFSLDLDLFSLDAAGGILLQWEGLLDMRIRKGGVLMVNLRAGAGGDELFQDVLLETPAGSILPERWQHLKLVAADGFAVLAIDGIELSRVEIPSVLGSPRSAAVFGADSRGWIGRLDEFTVWARISEAGPELPIDVSLDLETPKIRFDRHGVLDAASHAGPVGVKLSAFEEEISSFRIGRFTQEVAL